MDQRTTRLVDMPQQRRLAPVQSVRGESRTVSVMWSAGARVRRYDWFDDEYFIEELDMRAEAVDLSRLMAGAPVLNTHDSHSLSAVMGVVERAWLEGGKGYAELRFSERDDVQPFWRDVQSGIIRNVSVGYEVREMREVGRDKETGYRVLRVVKWQPFEISLVPVGADAEAGTRSAPAVTTRCALELEQRAVSQPAALPAASLEVRHMTTEVQAPPAGPQPAQDVVQLERDRKLAIENLCRGMNLDARYVAQWVSSGKDIATITTEALKVLEERGQANPAQVAQIGLDAKETHRYSLFRMIRACLPQEVVNKMGGDHVKWQREAAFEMECHRAVEAKVGPSKHGGFLVPAEVLMREIPGAARRDLVAGTGSAGGFLVETNNMSFIELLRNRAVLFNMGATRMSGMVGNVTMPRQTTGATANWMTSEAGAGVAESDQVFGQMSLTPKTVVGYTEISRQLQLQASPSAESIVMTDLAAQVALAVDSAGLNGTGTGVPTGIINTAGIGGFSGTTLGIAGIIEAQTDAAAANALFSSSGYVAHPGVAGLLMQRQRFTSTDTPLWDGNVLNGSVMGYRAMSSNQMPASRILFGDFSQLVVAEWGVLEVSVNPYTNFTAGIIGIRAMYSVDIGVRYPGAFSYSTAVT